MSLGSKGREGPATRCSLTVGGNAQYKRQQQRHGTTNMTANGKQSLHIAQKEKNGTLTTTKPYMRPASAPKHKSTQERRLERCAAMYVLLLYPCCRQKVYTTTGGVIVDPASSIPKQDWSSKKQRNIFRAICRTQRRASFILYIIFASLFFLPESPCPPPCSLTLPRLRWTQRNVPGAVLTCHQVRRHRERGLR